MSAPSKVNKENFRLLDLSSEEESEDLQLEIIPSRKKKITRYVFILMCEVKVVIAYRRLKLYFNVLRNVYMHIIMLDKVSTLERSEHLITLSYIIRQVSHNYFS